MTQKPGRLDLNSGFPIEYSDNSKGFASPKSENAKQQTMNHKDNFKVILKKWNVNNKLIYSI